MLSIEKYYTHDTLCEVISSMSLPIIVEAKGSFIAKASSFFPPPKILMHIDMIGICKAIDDLKHVPNDKI